MEIEVTTMPALDVNHAKIKHALQKEGWIITHDPFYIGYGDVDVYVDFGAERPFAAEKDGRKIAVEVKSFIGRSLVRDVEQALGQYILYRGLLEEVDPVRVLYLAIDQEAYSQIFQRVGFQMIISKNQIQLLVVDLTTEEIVRWID